MTVSIASARVGSWITRSLSEATLRLHPDDDRSLIDDLVRIAGLAEIHIGDEPWHPCTDGIVDGLEILDTLGELDSQVQRVRELLGLQHVTIASVKEAAASIAEHRMLTTWPRPWVQEYVDKLYQRLDPMFCIDFIKQPILLHEIEEIPPFVEGYLQKAQRAEIGPSGIVFWTEVSAGTVIAVALTSNMGSTEFQKALGRMGWDLFIISDALARAFARANRMVAPDPGLLTDGELTLLRAVVAGTSTKSPQVGSGNMIAEAPPLCQKLGVRTLAQAAVAIAATGMLTCAPLRMEEIWLSEDRAPRRSPRRTGGKPQSPANLPHRIRTATETPAAYSVRKYQHGWAVFRNSERISAIFARESDAESACTEAAWGSGPHPRRERRAD